MKPSHIAIARSLKDVPGMPTKLLGDIIHKLNADGYIAESEMHAVGLKDAEDGVMHKVSDSGYVKLQSLVQASRDPNKAPLIRSILCQFKQLGVDVDPNEQISMAKLDIQLKG